MKIKSLTLRNYKRFTNEQTISFCNEQGQVNDITLLIGENGSGKTSILQAITAVIGAASRPNMKVDRLDWDGFDYPFIQIGNMPLRMEMDIEFAANEREKTRSYAEELKKLGVISHLPNDNKEVRLSLHYNNRRVNANTTANYYQFSGYQYALQLKKYRTDYLNLFDDVGTIYWYTEQRTAHSIQNLDYNVKNTDALRNILAKMHYFHLHRLQKDIELRPGQRDSFETLNNLYQKVFPTRSLLGAEPNRDDMNKTDFWLNDGYNDYELSGLSAGERAVFPILLDFALMNINNSIIIIDEIELHLHPALLRDFLKVLPNLGNNNQFIITSHSPYVLRELPKENILIAKDGKVQPINVFTKGRDVSSIIEELFGIPRRTPEALQKIEAFYAAITQQQLDIAKQLLNEMETEWGTLDEGVVRAQMYYEDLLNDMEDEIHQ
ncbi:MAG: AAA family ATPase [Chitinophagales bacterium]|jgi:predicted ATP-dependent endonuclease of OLD family|nr:AAA family ATPase [Chitinophagales bacterium]